MEKYFETLETEVRRAHALAVEARKRGRDPKLAPEIPFAKDLAERVEGLVGPPGISGKIRKLEAELSREETAMEVAREIAEGRIWSFPSSEKALEQALRTSLAILTEGIVAAPLEGIVKAKIKKNYDDTKYLAIYFAGPIRSAGGSAQALAVLTGDYIRRSCGLDRYKPTSDEVERAAEETDLYNTEAARLQYLPSSQDIRKAVRNTPVEITGESTDPVEVSGYRDLERIETNRVRGGAVLVLAEGVLQKAPKLLKYVEKFKLDGWEWLGDFVASKTVSDVSDKAAVLGRNYLKDLIAGRPVLSYPSTKGGFRLRYGRSRASGYASVSLNPCTLLLLDDFIAIGTQIKTERPGKGAAVSSCDSIEGPVVRLLDGSVVRVEHAEDAERIKGSVGEILFLGDILISYGDFLENNHVLMPSGYVEEWWIQDVERALAQASAEEFKDFLGGRIPTQDEALKISEALGVPLHPRYTYFFHDISKDELKALASWLSRGDLSEEALVLRNAEEKRILEMLCVPHAVAGGKVVITEHKPLLRVLGMSDSLSTAEFLRAHEKASKTMDVVNSFGIKVMEKCPTYIGARMGRPEKAKERKMQPPVNVLFPVGNYGGRTRDVKKAAQNESILVEVARRKCGACGEASFKTLCPKCGKETALRRTCMSCGRETEAEHCKVCGAGATFFSGSEVRIRELFEEAVAAAGSTANDIKGVIGMTSVYKIPEPLEKGILRSKHGIYVFKDGTSRFDATDMPLTHFKPEEIGVSVEKLKELGYERDYKNRPLVSDDQILELRCQDILLSESGADYLLKVSKFLDELLVKIYGQKPFYNAEKKEDLLGHLVLGLAPHTSAAILGRIIGFTKASVGYAHPYFHAAKRRNCDGDEDAVFLLLDALLNFSEAYLPSTRGGKMDAPLVITTRIDPKEVDDEAHNIETVERYPLEFYSATMRHAKPQELLGKIEIAERKLEKPDRFSFGFTNDTSSIEVGPMVSAYKTLVTMGDKVKRQLELAGKIRSVDERDVARRVVESHFLPDLAGNLKAFSRQTIRCVSCDAKYRRVPLSGICRKCGGKLVLTVSRGSVEKYLEITQGVIDKYQLDNYLRQRIQIIKMSIASVFEDESSRQVSLSDFTG